MAVTTYLANRLLDHAIGKTAFTMPTVFTGLMKANPTDAGTQTNECTYPGYARVAVPGAIWNAAAARAQTNSAGITFGTKTAGADETATHWATFDALTGGNMLEYGPLSPTQLISNGTAPAVPTGNAQRSFT